MLAVLPEDVAPWYQKYGTRARLPIRLPCKADAFGIITRQPHVLSSAASVVLDALRTAARAVYGTPLLDGVEAP